MSATGTASRDLGRAGRDYVPWEAGTAFVGSRLNLREAALSIGFGGSVVALAAADGGYFPSAWGWATLGLAWAAGLGLLLRPALRLSTAELAFAGAISLFAVWTLLSAAWAPGASDPVLEAQRSLVYVSGAFAATALVHGRSYRALVAGTWGAIVLLCLYALGIRILPDRLGILDTTDGYRLSEPLGYWNALGIVAAIGAVLALGLAARARSALIGALAASSAVVLLPTLYFTFSRGSWIALGVGLVAALALDRRRLQLTTMLLLLLPAPALAVALASRADGLVLKDSTIAEATRSGHRLVLPLLALAGLAAGMALLLRFLERRIAFGRRARRAYAAALLLGAGAMVVGTLAVYGGPEKLAREGYDAFTTSNPSGHRAADPHERLFSFASPGRTAHWRVAWEQFRRHPWIGSGAGTFEQHWLQDRKTPGKVRDAHSLYLETLAELGVVGLGLLLVALAAPVVAAVKARRHALVPAAFGSYVAYLVHAGIDWDWEMPAVTLAALFCACAMLAAGRPRGKRSALGVRARAGLLVATVALAIVACVGLVGNQALAASKDAEDRGQLAHAEAEARTAIRWAPWSASGWERLADVHFARDDPHGARAALLEATEKDPGDWALWYDLGVASEGRERLRAYREAARLNPLSRNVAVLRTLRVLPPLEEAKR